MNILIISARLPYPLDSGAKIRAFHLLKSLASRHRVSLLTFYSSAKEEQYFPIIKSLSVELIPILNPSIDRLVGWKDLFHSFCSGLPLTVGKYFDPRMSKAIAEKICCHDVIHCEHMHMAQYLFDIKHLPKVLDAHNVESQIAERYAQCEQNPFRRLVLKWNFSKMLRYEKKIAADFDMIFPVSSQDLDCFVNKFHAGRVRQLENGVDLDYFRPAPPSIPEKQKLVFVGSMGWLPNSDGVKFFINEVLPLIRSSFPSIQVDIVGKDPPEDVVQFSGKGGVRITGSVDDVRPYVWESQVVIVPLRFGGGTRLKILEAFAMNKPVVSTTLGCEGIVCQSGNELLIADTPAEFANSVIRLLRDQDLRKELTLNARRLVVEKYSWEVIRSKITTYYDQIKS